MIVTTSKTKKKSAFEETKIFRTAFCNIKARNAELFFKIYFCFDLCIFFKYCNVI